MRKLKPCIICGKEPEVKYMAGISPSLAKQCNLESSTPYPRYYISCECGRYQEVQVTGITVEQRDKQKNQLIYIWNKKNQKSIFND